MLNIIVNFLLALIATLLVSGSGQVDRRQVHG